MRDHREELPPNLWEDAPAIYADGMLFALIGRDEDLVHDIAAEAIELDESYLETFGESAGSQLRYYNAKLLAATILDDDRWEDLLSGYIEAVGQIVPTEIREQKHVASDLRARLYGALYNREGELFASVFEKYLRGYAANTPLDTDDPEELLNDELTALCLLANDRGINVTIDSPFVPDVLVPDPSEAIHVVEVH
ncbi:hypothetical protein G3I44_07735 [Halogeometricum borinquense]|uniref:Uncharacterized protein n=2 Tax=Halogeometricum borinquense TaxID=60847 RepID=A0A6C0UFN4_9EURY|nr:Imm49 family immunity protein [Halogeometricum borinquense]QIB74195.1 hypothetical protein G3I44_07735 [Halogeometricum borinquense]